MAKHFFALVGPNHDGHIYIEELINKGVKAFVVHYIPENVKGKAVFLQVDNTLDALQKIAAYYRGLFHFPVIGITVATEKPSSKNG